MLATAPRFYSIARCAGRLYVILALLILCNATWSRAQDSSDLNSQRARTLYAQGQFAELGDYLKDYLRHNSADSRARAMLAMVFLRLNERDSAMAELATLQSSGETAKKYVAQIEQLLGALQQQEQSRENLRKALDKYDVQAAIKAVDQLKASPLQTGILYAYLDMYQGKFDEARTSLMNISTDRLTDKQSIKLLLNQVEETQKKHAESMNRIETYLYSEYTSSVCNSFLLNEKESHNGKYPFVSARPLQQYERDVVDLATISPLEPRVMDLTFHASLLGQNYKVVEQLGDQVLGSKGKLSIPFLSQNSYFYLTVDSVHRRIFTEPDQGHTLMVYYDYPALVASDYTPFMIFHAGAAKTHANQARWYEKEMPFDLTFDEITTLSQSAKDWRGGLAAHSFAVKFSPTAVAPNYLLMNEMACLYGEEAQRTATRNLGLFLVHVLEPHKIRADLVDPAKHTLDSNALLFSTMAGLYGTAAQNSGNALDMQNAALLSSVARAEDQKARELRRDQTLGRAAWYQAMDTAGFSVSTERIFAGIEELMGLS